jgi:hypothetical protein
LPLPGIESQFPSHPSCCLTIEMSCWIVHFVAWVMECTAKDKMSEEAEPVINAIQIRVYWLHEWLMIILGIYELIASQNFHCNHGVLCSLNSLVCQWFIVKMWSINVSCWLFIIKWNGNTCDYIMWIGNVNGRRICDLCWSKICLEGPNKSIQACQDSLCLVEILTRHLPNVNEKHFHSIPSVIKRRVCELDEEIKNANQLKTA